MQPDKLPIIVKAIVAQQKSIIGPMAIDLANRVDGIKVSRDLGDIQASGNANEVLTKLVAQYERLFGKASIEACKDSLKSSSVAVPAKDLPAILQ